jgi:Protein of unknown function, DUF481
LGVAFPAANLVANDPTRSRSGRRGRDRFEEEEEEEMSSVEGLRGRLPGLGSSVLLAIVAVGILAGTAAADEITSKGTVLRGKVTGLSSGGVTFEPEYGKGSLEIKWEDIEDIKSDGAFQVFHGEDLETVGAVQGTSDGALLIGASPEAAVRIDIASVFLGVPIGPQGVGFPDRMRSYWRYWDGHFDVAFNLQQATTDTTGFLLAFETVRTKDPTKLTLGASYRYSTQKNKEKKTDAQGNTFTDTTKNTIEDQALGLVRGDYSFTPRIYGFASGDATYDGIQELSIRGVPKIGAGYVLWEEKLDGTKRNFLQAEAGGGWVYERYFGGDTNNYFAVIFGALASYNLPYGSIFDWKLDYLPAVDDFTGDYLLRTEAGLSVPIMAPISAKLGLRDEYDSTPAANADRNSLYVIAGLSLVW